MQKIVRLAQLTAGAVEGATAAVEEADVALADDIVADSVRLDRSRDELARQVNTVFEVPAAAVPVLATIHAAPAAAYPACHGTFPSNGVANITVQSSAAHGIPWVVKLTSANSRFGVVVLSAQIYANNRQANVYAPHTEPWNYNFHGPLPRKFQKVGGGTYTMPDGATVSFLFVWHSAAHPPEGGYAYLNCKYDI